MIDIDIVIMIIINTLVVIGIVINIIYTSRWLWTLSILLLWSLSSSWTHHVGCDCYRYCSYDHYRHHQHITLIVIGIDIVISIASHSSWSVLISFTSFWGFLNHQRRRASSWYIKSRDHFFSNSSIIIIESRCGDWYCCIIILIIIIESYCTWSISISLSHTWSVWISLLLSFRLFYICCGVSLTDADTQFLCTSYINRSVSTDLDLRILCCVSLAEVDTQFHYSYWFFVIIMIFFVTSYDRDHCFLLQNHFIRSWSCSSYFFFFTITAYDDDYYYLLLSSSHRTMVIITNSLSLHFISLDPSRRHWAPISSHRTMVIIIFRFWFRLDWLNSWTFIIHILFGFELFRSFDLFWLHRTLPVAVVVVNSLQLNFYQLCLLERGSVLDDRLLLILISLFVSEFWRFRDFPLRLLASQFASSLHLLRNSLPLRLLCNSLPLRLLRNSLPLRLLRNSDDSEIRIHVLLRVFVNDSTQPSSL